MSRPNAATVLMLLVSACLLGQLVWLNLRYTPAPPSIATPKPKPWAGLTMKNYEKLQPGMRYAELLAILGQRNADNDFMPEFETIESVRPGGSVWRISLTFENGRLVRKSQEELR